MNRMGKLSLRLWLRSWMTRHRMMTLQHCRSRPSQCLTLAAHARDVVGGKTGALSGDLGGDVGDAVLDEFVF